MAESCKRAWRIDVGQGSQLGARDDENGVVRFAIPVGGGAKVDGRDSLSLGEGPVELVDGFLHNIVVLLDGVPRGVHVVL